MPRRPRFVPLPLLPLLTALTACSSGAPLSTPVLSPGAVEEPVSAVVAAALSADARAEPADTLWDRDATVVANGTLRAGPPRFAGVGQGGEVAITASRLEVRQSLVWIYLEYRWLALKDGTAREGKATLLLVPRGAGLGWKLIHAHSSTAPPEDTKAGDAWSAPGLPRTSLPF